MAQLTLQEYRDRLDSMETDEIFDLLSDSLHETADGLDIAEGEDRDAWRLAKLEDAGIRSDLEHEDLVDLGSALLLALDQMIEEKGSEPSI